ncbi:MAG TPA: sigma 54-interacting transcriptional regulator [Polyangiaceae bacterium]|jgi:DNA-binding NtrC family response regulator
MAGSPEDTSPSSHTLEIAHSSEAGTWMVEVQDERGARRVELGRERIVVGSSSRADLVVRDATVSSKHCALAVLGDGVVIEDLGSRNGTFVGTAKVKEAWARAGTAVAIGRSTLVVLLASPLERVRPPGEPLAGLAGGSIVMRRLADQVRRLARHALPVLVAGESGSGKELVARALHLEGPRSGKPFVAINVTALPRELVESELFGHERGAFTGAHQKRLGAFAEADGGTLFLDEVGDLPVDAQPKLLRALDGYEVRRVGAAGSGQRADVRVVAATHAPLEQRVLSGEFRRDLFHRLECFVLHVPPLRQRRGDIGAIARVLLESIAPHVGQRELTPAALARLAAHDWPGNVRELRNVLCRAADATSRSRPIDSADILAAMQREPASSMMSLSEPAARDLLSEYGGNLSAAARAAGMARTSFRKLVQR